MDRDLQKDLQELALALGLSLDAKNWDGVKAVLDRLDELLED